ncbi:MAG: flagellar biosynthesis anti-sigma factor FlgM [Rhodobacteraceae bacterium]|nr:flagellar biosynthesis anti-sigma factor FlgM [Paracoccaceae bacterium]
MVDPINISNLSRLRPTDTAASRTGGAAASPAEVKSPTPAADTVALTNDMAVAIERLSDLEPPMDAARLAIVKAQILEGAYPLDSQKLAETFFRDIGAMTGE